jgi:creatinine amidohydrolase
MNPHHLDRLSWPKIKTYLERSKTILVPIGSVEQEGSHLPTGFDTHTAQYICEQVSEKTGCLIGPPIIMGYSEWFMEFPGTISFSYELLLQLIREYCECLFKHGFRKFIFVSPHHGNREAVAIVGREFRHKGALVSLVDVWRLLEQIGKDLPELREKKNKHAGEIMTSIALAIYPEQVDLNSVVVEYAKSGISNAIKPKASAGPAEFNGLEIQMFLRGAEVTKSGTLGDPTSASEELGKLLLTKLVDYTVSFVSEVDKIEPYHAACPQV